MRISKLGASWVLECCFSFASIFVHLGVLLLLPRQFLKPTRNQSSLADSVCEAKLESEIEKTNKNYTNFY